MKKNKKISSILITTILFLSIMGFAIANTNDFPDFTGEGHSSCHGDITESSSGYISISSSSGSSVNPSETFTVTIQIFSFSEAQNANNIEVGFPNGDPGRGDNKEFTFNPTQDSIDIDSSGNSATLDFQVTAPATEQTYTLHSDAIRRAGVSGPTHFVQGNFIVTVEVSNNPPQFSNIVEISDPLEFGQQETFQVDVTDSETTVDTVFIELEGTNYTMTNTIGDTFQYDWTPNTLGIKNYVIYANDTTGSWNSTTGSINVIDTTNPTLKNLIESADPLELGQTETIQINATDLSGISQVLIEIDSTNYTMANIGGTIWEYDSWTPITTGLKSYTIFTNDTEDNWNTLDDSITVQDTVQPSLTNLVESADPLELGQIETIQIDVGDLSGISHVLIEIGSVNISMNQIDTNTYQYNTWSPSSVGVKSYTIHANDTNGNWNSLSNSITVEDTKAPKYSDLIESADPLPIGQNETISIKVYDTPGSGVKEVILEYNNINHTMVFMGLDTWSWSNWKPSSTGIFNYIIYMIDNSDNLNTTAGSIEVIISMGPTIQSVSKSADPLELGQLENVQVDVNDTDGISDVIIEIGSQNYTMGNVVGMTYEYSWTPSITGTQIFTVYANDSFNNWNQLSDSIFVQDTTPPNYSNLIENSDPLELGNALTIFIDVTDLSGVNQVKIEFNGMNYSMSNLGGDTWSNDTWIPDTAEIFPYTIFIQDNSNNWNSTSGFIEVIDTISPELSNLYEEYDPIELGQSQTIRVNISDLSPISSVVLEYEGVNYTMTKISSKTWEYINLIPVSISMKTYSIYANDSSNNWISLTSNFTVVDTNGPVLSNLFENADPLELGQTVTIQINATDLSGISHVLIEINSVNYTMVFIGGNTWEYTSWTPNTIGVKMYTLYANDTNDNWNSLDGDITIVDPNGPSLGSLFENTDPLELGQMVTIQINATDISGISHVLIEIDSVNYTMVFIGSDTWEYNSWTPSTTGLKLYSIFANDTGGNWNTLNDSITVQDTIGPTLSIIIKSAESIFLEQSVSIQVDVTDLSGINNVIIEFENSNHTMAYVNGNTWEINNWTPSTTGTLSFTIYARDSLGNWNSESDSITVTIQGGNGNIDDGVEDFDLIVIFSTIGILGIIAIVLVIIQRPKRFIK
jgi:hypothetical protein